jgi:hypothetical protein
MIRALTSVVIGAPCWLTKPLLLIEIVLWLALASCVQQSPALRTPQDQMEAVRECDRMIFGDTNAERVKSGYVYDMFAERWLIDERADEITKCLFQRHGWTASVLPDGRRAAQLPR